jgi:putative Mn2+ efflux pump MntP
MSQFLEILSLGLILSADSFSAAVAMGSRRFLLRDLLIFAFASAGAEALSTLIGFFAGSKVISQISAYDHWIAFGLLLVVALHMVYEGFEGLFGKSQEEESESFHSFFRILVVSFATSMDAFGVGIGLGVANKPIWAFVGSIGFWAFAATVFGLYLGRSFSKKLGPIFTLIAAAVLGYLAVVMLRI